MVVRRIDYLTETEKRQYRERSKMAVNGIDVLLRNLYLITSKGNITDKYRTIAQYIGLVPDGNSHYNYFIPVQQDIVFLLRLSNHNNENEELYNQHEQKGHPDVRFILFFQGSGYSLLFSGVFCKAKHYVYNYPINGLDSEEDVIRFLSSLRELFIKGQAIFRGADAPEPRQTNNDIISQWNRTIDRNNESKTNKNMKKNTIKLNESQLKKIVAESVKNVLLENCFHSSNPFETSDAEVNLKNAIHELKETVNILETFCKDGMNEKHLLKMAQAYGERGMRLLGMAVSSAR